MNKKLLFENIKALFYAIINHLDKKDQEIQEYEVIIPKFSTPNQVESKRFKKKKYATMLDMNNTILDNFTEYHQLMEFLENNSESNRDLIEKLIVQFFNTILHLCREKDCEYKIENFIEILYNDLLKTPMVYHIKEYITGISLEDENYQIEENLNIRRAKPNDFECSDMGEYISELELYSFQFPPVILEYTYISSDHNEYYNDFTTPKDLIWELENLDWALLLFRSAPIFRLKTESGVISIFTRSKTTLQGLIIRMTSEKYIINKNNIKDLRKIIKLFQSPKIQDIFNPPNNKPNHINITLNRYQNAYIYSGNKEQQITSLISCLEALLSEGIQELKRRLYQRISIILKTIDFNPLNVYKNLDLAYRVRNFFSHGNYFNWKSRVQNPNEFVKNLFEYTRLCFLISLQIYSLKTKNQYLNLIDKALLDENVYLELLNLIKSNCIIFKD